MTNSITRRTGGWLAYGAALNEGRALFPGDREFGQWKQENVLSQVGIAQPKADEELAAMWAAGNRDQFEEARAAGSARTVRGIHDKWKKIEAEREAEAKRLADEAARKEREAKAQAEAEAKRKEAAERQIAAELPTMDDIASITDTRDRIAALEQYLRGKQMHLPALGAQRRLEARIGELLPVEQGKRTDRLPTHAEEVVSRDGDKADFRILARALDGSTDLTADEWRQSRPRPTPSASLGA